jgi:hypothetical protein
MFKQTFLEIKINCLQGMEIFSEINMVEKEKIILKIK